MIYSIGHSNHALERFVTLLQQHEITAVADVRSSPHSRFNPHFNRESLQKSLAENAIRYVFLGEQLGARTKDRSCYEADRVSYRKLAATDLFRQGLDRLQTEMTEHKLAMMCAEKEPLDCHRTILVARELLNRGVPVAHILENGLIEPHEAVLTRLRNQLKVPAHDLFRSDVELDDEAYELQGQRIAYVRPPATKGPGRMRS